MGILKTLLDKLLNSGEDGIRRYHHQQTKICDIVVFGVYPKDYIRSNYRSELDEPPPEASVSWLYDIMKLPEIVIERRYVLRCEGDWESYPFIRELLNMSVYFDTAEEFVKVLQRCKFVDLGEL